MTGPRIVDRLDSQTVVVEASTGNGTPWLFVGGNDRLPADAWGCACQYCAGPSEQLGIDEGEFWPLTFTRSHALNAAPS